MTASGSAGSTGYSGTPLVKKLGIRENYRVLSIAAPRGYRSWLTDLPDSAKFCRTADDRVDLVHLFVTDEATLLRQLKTLRTSLRPEVPVWVSWPKKSSPMATEVTEDVIRKVALPLGWVDIKVCAVNETWSGLKLVVRKELRNVQ